MENPSTASLIGTWRLISYKVWNAEWQVSEPKGAQPFGYAVFTPDGLALIQVAIGPDEDASAGARASSFAAYCGPVTVSADAMQLEISVEASNIEGYIGTQQVRKFSLSQGQLTLGQPGQYQAVLQRVQLAA